MGGIDYSLRPAESSDRSRLANLIHFGPYIHQHLDWKAPLDWIGRAPYYLMESDGILVAALACPPDIADITWVRLFAAGVNVNVNEAWRQLWEKTVLELRLDKKIHVAALSLQGWFNELLESSGFVHTDDVVVLIWEHDRHLPPTNPAGITMRPMVQEDLPEIAQIDNSAFDLVWRNSMEALELAFQQSSLASVAEIDDEIVGFQYSTYSNMGGHLARLAVKPSQQNRGIGYLLVLDVIRQFNQKGAFHVTVNTQRNNNASLALYSHVGFKNTGESYRVYQY